MSLTQVKHITELRLELFIINNDSTILRMRMTRKQSFCCASEITQTAIYLLNNVMWSAKLQRKVYETLQHLLVI